MFHIRMWFQYYNQGGIPSRSLTNDICAVCGQRILVDVEEEGFIEDTYQLSCGHMYPKAQSILPANKDFYPLWGLTGRSEVKVSICTAGRSRIIPGCCSTRNSSSRKK